MRIKRLDLKAFGPFTNQSIVFDTKPGVHGLHIIYGPNEAGKSCSLRALKALLYGFPERTPDNFLHAGTLLTVGGCLENNDGRIISFQRRKKRKADILDDDGNPLADNTLDSFLHGVAPEMFETLYGIDHEALVQGGRDILAQKGEVGKALFAAGAGLSALTEIIEGLEKEASELFKPAGKNPAINLALKRYKDLQKEAKEASLSAKVWNVHRSALKQAEDQRTDLEKQREDKSRELHRLERLKRVIPEMGLLNNLHQQLAALGDVVMLPPDFSQQNQKVGQEIKEAEQRLDIDLNRLRLRKEKRDAISLNKSLLDHAERTEDFHQRLGEYRKGQKDRPERNGMRISLRREAGSILKQVRPDMPLDDVEQLRPMLSKKRTIQGLATRHESIRQQQHQAGQQHADAIQALEETGQRLAAMPAILDNKGLLQAFRVAQKAGSIDDLIAAATHTIEAEQRESLAQLRRIGLWEGGLTSLTQLPLPLSDTIKEFENENDSIRGERKELEQERKEILKALETVSAEVKKLVYAGEVPSESELTLVREKREQGWQLLRRYWLNQENVADHIRAYNPDMGLPEAYEEQVLLADHIADRLRREAERVTNAAALRAREDTLREAMIHWEEKKTSINQREAIFDQQWHDLWKLTNDIKPLSPRAMGSWLAEMDKLRYRAGDIQKKEREKADLANHRKSLRENLVTALTEMGEHDIPEGQTIGPVLVLAEEMLERTENQNKESEKYKDRHKDAQGMLTRTRDFLKDAGDAFDKWQKEWEKAIAGLGFAEDVSPDETLDRLDLLKNCFDRLKEADDLQKRIDGIDRDAEELQMQVRGVLDEAAPALTALPVDQAVLQLKNMLNQVQKDQTVANELAREIDSLETDMAQTGNILKSSKEQQQRLFECAGVDKPDDLAAVIYKYTEYERLLKQVSDTESNLGRIGEGVSLEELSRQAAEIDASDLPGRIAMLREEIEKRINPEINRLSQLVGEESTKLAAMDGRSRAAEIVEKMEQVSTEIHRHAERYVRVKLALSLLQKEIERYREERQEPILKIAAAYFTDLTLGSFSGLRTDIDDSCNPVLAGIRPDGTRIPISGMSDGTRDQLYLSLRLATLEWRLESSEPIPFIVDDILINFDDARTRATLQALADLSDKNQVILFTHHGQVVEEAGKIQNRAIMIHCLDASDKEILTSTANRAISFSA